MSKVNAHLSGNFVAYLALFVALGGSAYAAATVKSGDIKNETIKSKDIKDNAVAGRDLKDGSVGTADLSADAVGGATVQDGSLGDADVAANGLTGAAVNEGTLDGVARAMVRVAADGTVQFSEGLGAATVSHPLTGLYCFNNLSFDPQVVVASGSSFAIALANDDGPPPGCPDADASVLVYEPSTATATDSRLYVLLR